MAHIKHKLLNKSTNMHKNVNRFKKYKSKTIKTHAYEKSSFCIYCGKQSLGKPFCSSCLKKYFNYDRNKKISNFILKQRSSYPMQWFEINDYNMNRDNSNVHSEPWLSDSEINIKIALIIKQKIH